MKTTNLIIGLLTASALVEAPAQTFTSQYRVDDCHFSTFGGHPHFFLNPGHQLVLGGEEDGEQKILVITALNATKAITLTQGNTTRRIVTRVIEERESVDGELAEVSRNWYARCLETGDVYYFGEEVDFYEDGVIVSHEGAWEAGVDDAQPGIIMPATFMAGARYYQEFAPGAATDQAENFELGLTVSTPAGTFENCVSVLETNPLEPASEPELKTYAPGIGLIGDADILALEEFRLGTEGLPRGGTFVPFSNHPFFPFAPGRRLVLEGIEDGEEILLEIVVLDETRPIALEIGGEPAVIQTRVIEERESVDGELAEISRNFFAQCLETGDVFYFGEEVDFYEDGEIVGHQGAWLAGVSNAVPGIIMPGHFAVGAQYYQEVAPGVAEDFAVNSAVGVTMTVPAGTFTGCVTVTESNPLEPGSETELKTYAPGLGLISDAGILELTEWSIPGTSGEPILAIQDAVLLTWPLTDETFRLEQSADLTNWTSVLPDALPVDGLYRTTLPGASAQVFFRLTTP